MSGGIAGRGRPGPAGPAGPMGPQGPQGEPAFTLAIGEVSAVPYGQEPAVTNVGTDQEQVWDLALVTGATGVLTGAAPPTGSDGTSLGQLYFCTTNRTYYGLVELSENDNKWSPIMTQSTAIREYSLDLMGFLVGNQTGALGPQGKVGVVSIRMDDVQKKVSAHLRLKAEVPIRESERTMAFEVFADSHEISAIRADLVAQGVISVPMPVTKTVNGESTTVYFDFATATANSYLNRDSLRPLSQWALGQEPDGSQPGVAATFKDGKLAVIANETGAPGATAYGKAPMLSGDAEDLLVFIGESFIGDTSYPTGLAAASSVVIQYGS